MKIVVIGGTGLIGSKLVKRLREQGHEALPASLESGVNTITGQGLAQALSGASVVVDVSDSPSFEDAAVMKFFETSTRNLLLAESEAGVKHHVALSVVGTERVPESGYLRAKAVQERLIKASSIPYSIVHSTQFFEFAKSIAAASTDGDTVRVAPVLVQPVAAEDVARFLSEIATSAPVNAMVEIGGPERLRLDAFVDQGLSARKDPRKVVADPRATYFGAQLSERSLVPGANARLGRTRFADWLAQSEGPPAQQAASQRTNGTPEARR